MKRILLIIFTVVLIALVGIVIFKGISLGTVEILSFSQIQNKNIELDDKLQKINTLISIDYPQAINNLNDDSKKLIAEKEAYADMVQRSSNEEVIAASYVEKHNLEHLWVVIGNYATKNGITLKLEIASSSTGVTGQYNLNFTANGEYVSISEFIAALEEDSSLQFKIEDFKLTPSSVSDSGSDSFNLQATFVVRDVAINMEKAGA